MKNDITHIKLTGDSYKFSNTIVIEGPAVIEGNGSTVIELPSSDMPAFEVASGEVSITGITFHREV